MDGRLENKIKRERRIKNILNDYPQYLTDYYYNIANHNESSTCLEYIKKNSRFLKYCDDCIDNFNIKNISDTDISKFLKSIETKNVNGNIEENSFSTWKQYRAALNSFFSYLYEKGYINDNPVKLIKPPKQKDKVIHTFLSPKDLNEILKAIELGAGHSRSRARQKKWKTRDMAIMYILITTGMRESALCEMNIDSIDFTKNEIIVVDKGYKENRYTITPNCKKEIYEWLDDRKKLLGTAKSDALFISNNRTRMIPESVRNIVKKYTKSAIGKEVTPHRIRAAYGNILYKKTKGDLYFVKEAMKHADISTTSLYIEDNEKEINERAASIMGNLF